MTDAPGGPREDEDPFGRGSVINGRYRVIRQLGRGGMGAVYRVDDQLYPGRPTALKVFLHEVKHAVELFRTEFKTMASLRHPNVVRVYDFGTVAQHDAIFFTMELIQGTSLSHWARYGGVGWDSGSRPSNHASAQRGMRPRASEADPWSLGWREVVDLLVPVVRALSYLHKRSVVHFDLKPSNIMVDQGRQQRQVKVLDFGIAGLRLSGEGWMGTPLYLSPEVAENATGDHRSDLYSLGVMAFELLSGEVPYDTNAGFERLLQQKLSQPLCFPSGAAQTVPLWLQQLVERLCAVVPAQRPAAASDVLDQINRSGGLTYELETEETRESYLSSSRFVGRGPELAEIRGFIGDSLDGRARGALLVAGKSGMGKSRLMREVRQAVQLGGVTFAEADCFERDLSEAAPMVSLVLQAVSLAKSTDARDLLTKYGSEMVKLVPALAQDANLVPTPPLENADAERRRMLEATGRFFVGLGMRAPFVLYVNDLQWARDGTIDILLAILRERAGAETALAVLGSYRTDDVAGRPIGRLVDPGSSTALPVKFVELWPLEEPEVAELLRSMLGLSALPAGLGSGVMASSGGLPFFVEEVLRDLLEQGKLRLQRGVWTVDHGDGGDLQYDAAASFLRRSARVESTERQLLDLLAVCGRPTGRAVLTAVSRLEKAAAREALRALIDKQMVVAIAGDVELYNLAHDRMRETLYASLELRLRTELHLSLARTFAAELASGEQGDRLFECVSHFEQAEALLRGEGERLAVARLHLRAALATNATGAFVAGVAYLERAKSLMSECAFEQDYALTLAIEHCLAASLVPLGRIDEALLAADRIVRHAKSVLDEAPGWEVRILAYTARNEYRKAIAAGLEICGRLGMALPRRPTRLAIVWSLVRVVWLLRGRTDQELTSLPPMHDLEAMRLTRILTAMTGCAYTTEPNLWPILIARCVTLMLRHGRGPTHALLFAWFATALAAAGAHSRARRFTRLALRLIDAPDGAAFQPKLHHAMGQFLSHWRDPLSRSVVWCRSGVELGERVEDVEFAGYCHMGWAKASFDAGEPLRDVQDTCRAALVTIRASGQKGTELMHLPSLQAVENLLGLTSHGWQMKGPHYDDDESASAGLSNAQDGFRLLEKVRLACLFRRRVGIAQGDELLRVMNVGLPATFYFSIAHYFACLAWLQECDAGVSLLRRFRCLMRVARVRRTLRRWALRCPDNFDHRYLLVEAERLRALGRDAGPAYLAAIEAAQGNGFVQDGALANELAAEFHLARADEAQAKTHLHAALARYREWGAMAKVDDIVARYPALTP
jgi:serine/threonine protein kinase